MSKLQLGVGPMSPEIIEGIFRYSHFNRKELMLIASKNQIDHKGGYVNNWTTEEYAVFLKKMKEMYPDSKVLICRDHCGPGFNGNYDLEDTYKTIEEDIKNGFDLIHIDFCHFKGNREEKMDASKKAVEHCLKLNPNIQLEIGTDENAGINFNVMNLGEIEEEIDFFKTFCSPKYYVVQTGSLVKEINQVGNFNKQFVEKVSVLLKSKGLTLKEHNADYLSKEGIAERGDFVEAMNIAPQLGVVQTSHVITKCLIYGIDFSKFEEIVYYGNKWKKWLYNNTEENKFLCLLIAGHYHFGSDEFKEIMDKLSEREDIKESIITKTMEVIDHYESCK